jgi:hypothetical protein
MPLMSLPDAWQWVQIGFCAALGGSVVLVLVTVVTNLSLAAMFPAPAVRMPEDPHCSLCCPNDTDD